MSDQERLVRFTLLGQDFTFYTGSSEEEMKEILELVKKMVEDNTTGVSGTLPASRVAVMACLNMASKFIRLKRSFEDYKIETEGRINSINMQLEALFLLLKDKP